jgi:hypothetical protein
MDVALPASFVDNVFVQMVRAAGVSSPSLSNIWGKKRRKTAPPPSFSRWLQQQRLKSYTLLTSQFPVTLSQLLQLD